MGCDWSAQFAFGGLDGPVYAQTTFDDGGGEALYVGGGFLTAGGVPVFGVARWDGTSFSALGSGMDDIVFALATFDDGSGEALYAGGFFTTAGGVPAAGIAKWDGTAWSALGSGVDDSVFALTVFDDGGGGGPALYAGGFFSTAGGSAAANIAKWDGTAWSALGLGVDDEVDALTVFDDDGGGGPALYAGGFFELAGGAPAEFIASWDGSSWSPVGLGMSDGVVALEVFDDSSGAALYAGGFFAFADGGSVFGIAQWDGIGWTDLDTGMDAPVLSLATYDDGSGAALYAGGFFAFAGSVVLSPGVARWDGAAWSALGAGVGGLFFTEVDSLGVFDDGGGGDLFAGGVFFEAGGSPSSFLASWDGSAWSAVLASGPNLQGLDGTVFALQVFDDGSGPALYAGGDFATAGGVPVFGIARWDGSSWSALGSGMECLELLAGEAPAKGLVPFGCFFPTVQALAVYDDGSGPALYAGGEFDFAGGVPAANIAKWDGTSWSALDVGTDDIVEALEVFDDGSGPDLYAGGEFDFVGGTPIPASKVARWDGSAWSALGLGVDDDVETLEVFDDGSGPDLYAGGELLSAGGLPASYVARWDGAAWSPVGLGTDGEVEVLFSHDDGGGADLYAGGAFDVAGALAAPSIARWDGSAWSAVGTGVSSSDPFRTVDALARFDDGSGTDLYAGGFFDLAGGVSASNVARWNGAAFSALGAGTDEEVEALAAFNAGAPSLYAGGFFAFAGGLPSSYIARWQCPVAELTIDDVTLAEGDAGTTDFVFTITRSHNLNDVAVYVASADGSALAGVDYTALPLQTVALPAGGSLSATVTVPVLGDVLEELPVKSFFVDLSAPLGATIADGQGVGTILDDDDDGIAPSVSLVDSILGTGDGELAECEEARVAVHQLRVTFDRPVRDPAGDAAADDVTNPANYRLFAAGPDRDLSSSTCSTAAGDDGSVAILFVTYDAGTRTATLELGAGPLIDGPYRLVVCGSIADLAGSPLAGGDFARTFRAERTNLLVNGQLDCDLSGWTGTSTAAAEITHDGADVDGASISGSAAIVNLTASNHFSIEQCVPVSANQTYSLRGAVRLAAAPGLSVVLNRGCRFYGAAGCSGTSLLASLDLLPLEDTGGAWLRVAAELTAPAASSSASCSFAIAALGAESFDVGLDDLALVASGPSDLIFADGFESGDVSAWSVTQP